MMKNLRFALEEDDTIIGGYECRKNSVPYQVSLYTGYNFCGGILLTCEWVLSAAHCYKSSPLEVCLGEHNIKEPEDTEQHIMSAWFICHPDYNSGTQDSDIALIKLSQPATLNSYVSSVALPTKCGTAGTMCQVSGWGAFVPATKAVMRYPDTLQYVEVPLLTGNTCLEAYFFQMTENMICAGFMEGGKDSCQGDSGAPLVCDGELQGVVSWLHGCALRKKPGIQNTMASG
uniref:trypsin n=1 Tax=Salmo trutta TaxID=8032 RepID=A0A673XVI9_SALTR